MKKYIALGITFLLLISSKTGFTQSEEPQSSVSNVFKLNFFLSGVSYEQKIARYASFHFGTYVDGLISSPDESANNQAHLLLPK